MVVNAIVVDNFGRGWAVSQTRAYAASQTTVMHMKRLNQTESVIFVILCVLCFQRQSFFTFIPPQSVSHRPSRKHAYIMLTPFNPTFI